MATFELFKRADLVVGSLQRMGASVAWKLEDMFLELCKD
jgi:hypothetical protein